MIYYPTIRHTSPPHDVMAGVLEGIERWVYCCLCGQGFSVAEGLLLFGDPQKPKESVRLSDIASWQVYQSPGVVLVEIKTIVGETFDWEDRFSELEEILKRVATDKELPWRPY